MAKMKTYTLDELTDKYIGKIGTPERDKFEQDLKEELEAYLNFCYEGDSGVLDLGCIRIDKEYDNCFYGYL